MKESGETSTSHSSGGQKIQSSSHQEGEILSTVWVRSDVVNIRAKPDLYADIVRKVYQGDSLHAYDQNGDWTQVSRQGLDLGWIYSPLISLEPVEPPPAIRVAAVQQKVTERNDLWWRYSYIITLAVNRPASGSEKVVVKFIDDDGIEVDSDIVYLSQLDKRQVYTLRDNKLIDTPKASQVDSVFVVLEG